MSFSRKVPVLAASIAAAALFVAAPASAQTGGTKFTSNAAGPNSSMMAKSGTTQDSHPSSATQDQGADKGSSLASKAGNSRTR